MTEQKIFEILLKNLKTEDYDFDYPKLQKATIHYVSQKFADIIYDTLKQKSTASSIKRGNILKFINSLCEVEECHANNRSYDYFLTPVKHLYTAAIDVDLNKICCEAYSDLNNCIPNSFTDEVVMFQRKKYSKRIEQMRKLEFVKMMDQEKINAKYDMQVRKNFNYYETNEKLIRDTLGQAQAISPTINPFSEDENIDYREKQIKLAYTLLNIGKDAYLIENILQRLLKYKSLNEFEINFIQYLWTSQDNFVTQNLLVEKFPFLLERIILKYCTEILVLNEERNVNQYFMQLHNDKNLIYIRRICNKNLQICHTVKNLIYELYCYSFCNQNVLKLVDFIA